MTLKNGSTFASIQQSKSSPLKYDSSAPQGTSNPGEHPWVGMPGARGLETGTRGFGFPSEGEIQREYPMGSPLIKFKVLFLSVK